MPFADTHGCSCFQCQRDPLGRFSQCRNQYEKKTGFPRQRRAHGPADEARAAERLDPPDGGGRGIALAGLPPFRRRLRRDRFRWVREHVEITRKHQGKIDNKKEDQ